MAFSNTLTIPHADGNIVLTKINQDGYSSEYRFRNSVHEVKAIIRHTETKAGKDRHNVEFSQTIFATESVAEISRKVYIVLEQSKSDVDVKLTDALADWLIASSDAAIASLLGWES